jgi:hypothetical protein
MNRRINDLIKHRENINMDRDFFNKNTRQDKIWGKQNNNKKNILKNDDVNLDRQIFNIDTNHHKTEINKQVVDRRFQEYLNINNIRNKKNINANRIQSKNERKDKVILKDQTQLNERIFTFNPLIIKTNTNKRIQTIDTTNINYEKYKSTKNKFNPDVNY